mmetsp:Transcript_2854/g.9290  ORF Transcript_2854/g.9290 Transcript_2854/m.9290 type:complete len:500 (+) Transcript_2854:422-1921(+)
MPYPKQPRRPFAADADRRRRRAIPGDDAPPRRGDRPGRRVHDGRRRGDGRPRRFARTRGGEGGRAPPQPRRPRDPRRRATVPVQPLRGPGHHPPPARAALLAVPARDDPIQLQGAQVAGGLRVHRRRLAAAEDHGRASRRVEGGVEVQGRGRRRLRRHAVLEAVHGGRRGRHQGGRRDDARGLALVPAVQHQHLRVVAASSGGHLQRRRAAATRRRAHGDSLVVRPTRVRRVHGEAHQEGDRATGQRVRLAGRAFNLLQRARRPGELRRASRRPVQGGDGRLRRAHRRRAEATGRPQRARAGVSEQGGPGGVAEAVHGRHDPRARGEERVQGHGRGADLVRERAHRDVGRDRHGISRARGGERDHEVGARSRAGHGPDVHRGPRGRGGGLPGGDEGGRAVGEGEEEIRIRRLFRVVRRGVAELGGLRRDGSPSGDADRRGGGHQRPRERRRPPRGRVQARAVEVGAVGVRDGHPEHLAHHHLGDGSAVAEPTSGSSRAC